VCITINFYWYRPYCSSRFFGLSDIPSARTMPERDVIDDPKHWRERAEEARATAGKIKDPASKEAMLRVATDYDRRAEYVRIRAEVRSWSKGSGSQLRLTRRGSSRQIAPANSLVQLRDE
jgi:hypothetical protein